MGYRNASLVQLKLNDEAQGPSLLVENVSNFYKLAPNLAGVKPTFGQTHLAITQYFLVPAFRNSVGLIFLRRQRLSGIFRGKLKCGVEKRSSSAHNAQSVRTMSELSEPLQCESRQTTGILGILHRPITITMINANVHLL